MEFKGHTAPRGRRLNAPSLKSCQFLRFYRVGGEDRIATMTSLYFRSPSFEQVKDGTSRSLCSNHDSPTFIDSIILLFLSHLRHHQPKKPIPVQAARNIRNLPCVVRKSGLKGVCMFAIDCIKSNGTHLGTCIDKFYFGSCCQMKVHLDTTSSLNTD